MPPSETRNYGQPSIKYRDHFVIDTVTVDDTCVRLYEVERKKQSTRNDAKSAIVKICIILQCPGQLTTFCEHLCIPVIMLGLLFKHDPFITMVRSQPSLRVLREMIVTQ